MPGVFAFQWSFFDRSGLIFGLLAEIAIFIGNSCLHNWVKKGIVFIPRQSQQPSLSLEFVHICRLELPGGETSDDAILRGDPA
jgi:hypothetical protein